MNKAALIRWLKRPRNAFAVGGDELNRIIDGGNYGWPLETLGTRYNGLPIPNTISYGRHDVYAAPVFAWLPSVAVSSLAVIDNFHES
ncbi:MAG: PQQ-dependent sugar dehydrogenase [Alphaproteobacteria bacterium]|nr:PQQ-dependent sugar dehydrogenase [Alphaproteobacteria bacterium]